MELVWNLYGIVCMNFFFMDTCWRFGIPFFCVESLFGLVVVLNRGKWWVLGEMLSVFFQPMFLFWPSLTQIE